MVDRFSWRIVLGSRTPGAKVAIPEAIVTLAPGFRHEGMPSEVGLLLPNTDGPKRLIDAVVQDPALCGNAVLGLFLASPFLNLTLEAARLMRAGARWITNLPSVEQQDPEFSQQLADVGLDRGRELACLAQLRKQGFRIAAVVADGPGAAAAAAIEPEAMIILPRVADFAAGFPSLRQRGAAAQAVAEAAAGADWSGLLLGLAEGSDADHEALWPDRLDGLVCRPRPA
ncbi:MAG: hypothetical protein QNJ30_05075 [Kiloniellales bacterium]|nr:hypothetical protein [Kiloniellales bacterium]